MSIKQNGSKLPQKPTIFSVFVHFDKKIFEIKRKTIDIPPPYLL